MGKAPVTRRGFDASAGGRAPEVTRLSPELAMSRPSIAARAGLAVALMIGFYVLAFGIAAGLLLLVYAQVVWFETLYLKISAILVAGAGLIVWSVLPRIDRFHPPGPRLDRREHPRLFTELERIAAGAQQQMPREVYATHDLNAWVAQRGGIMGFGSRRVMGLGLPLLDAVTISELRAVLAHEFGHFHGGDTRLGPWIYKTRSAIERTLHTLAEHMTVLAYPFLWYGNAFLRITHSVSRRQELAADALAARVAGRGAMAKALRTIHGAGDAFGFYWSNEVVPAISRGFRPPVAAGFKRFVKLPEIQRQIVSNLSEAIASGTADPYDTHPSLKERLASLDALPHAPEPPLDDRPATSLIGRAEELEPAIVDSLIRTDLRGTLEPLPWEEAGEKLWIPVWREQVEYHGASLRAIRTDELPELAREAPRLVMRMQLLNQQGMAGEQEIAQSQHLAGAALAILLHARGFSVTALPGEQVRLCRGDVVIEPFSVVRDLARGALDSGEWMALCEKAGIADRPLLEDGVAGGELPAPSRLQEKRRVS